jgi:hypothetical protein
MRAFSASLPILVGLVCQIAAQTPTQRDQDDVTVYEHVFQDVIDILAQHVFVGDPPTTPPLQQAFRNIVLTDQEAESLKAIAVDYKAKAVSLLAATGPLRMEARFQSIESGQISKELSQRIVDLDGERRTIGLLYSRPWNESCRSPFAGITYMHEPRADRCR